MPAARGYSSTFQRGGIGRAAQQRSPRGEQERWWEEGRDGAAPAEPTASAQGEAVGLEMTGEGPKEEHGFPESRSHSRAVRLVGER